MYELFVLSSALGYHNWPTSTSFILGTFSRDTVCEPCDLGTFFSPTNSSEDRCMSCSYCNETEVVVAQCSTVSDTQCNTTGLLFEPRHEKICLRDFRPGNTQTGLRSHREELEAWNFGYRRMMYFTIQAANNKGVDETARMRRLICTFVVRIWHKTGFLMTWPILFQLADLFQLSNLTANKLSRIMRKPVLCHMWTKKANISLRIRAVWSAPLLFAAYIV